MKKTIALLLVTMSLLPACKKDHEAAAPAITLQAKWTLDNTVVKEYLNGTLVYNTTMPGNGTFVDFQSNGNLVVTVGTTVQSSPYVLLPGSKVQFEGSIYEIRSLTVSGVVLYTRDDYAPNEYDETFISLKK